MRLEGVALTVIAAALLPASACLASSSPIAPLYDPRVVTVHGVGDGRVDDTAAIQSAIKASRGKTGEGIVSLPSGRYRSSRSLLVPQGADTHLGRRFSDTPDTSGFVTAKVGERVHLSNGSEDKPYSGLVGEGGAVTDLRPFADRGGESVATDAAGNVHVANRQVFVFDPAGRSLGRIDVPERPLQLIFGGSGRRTLFILTHHALYAMHA